MLFLFGDPESIAKQAAELSGYLKECGIVEAEAWIRADRPLNSGDLPSISGRVKQIRLITPPIEISADACIDTIAALLPGDGTALLGSSPFLGGIAVRAAQRLGGTPCTEVLSHSREDGLIVEKTVFANNLKARFRLKKEPFTLSVARGMRPDETETGSPPVEELTIDTVPRKSRILARRVERLEKKIDLSESPVVVAAGRGIGGKANVALVEKLAALLGAQTGGSRPAVMNGWLPMERLIGASGTVVSPEISLTLGVSGAAPFMAGIDKSRLILSVNNDPKALVFGNSDLYACADYRNVVEEMIALLEERGENG